MIQLSELALVGKTGKTHGIKGELTFEFSEDFDIDACDYFVFEMICKNVDSPNNSKS